MQIKSIKSGGEMLLKITSADNNERKKEEERLNKIKRSR